MRDPDKAKTLFFEGIDLFDAKDYPAAEARFRAALALVPDRVSALTNLAGALFRQDKLDEAVRTGTRAVTLDPRAHEGWLVLGTSLTKLGRHDEAGGAFERAIALAPDDPATLMGRASLNTEMGRYDRAAADLERALRIDPGQENVLSLLVSARRYACDWTHYPAETETVLADVRRDGPLSNPFLLLSMPSTAADQLAAARAFMRREYPANAPPLYTGEPYRHARIRVAYVSGDFRQHPLARLMVGIFEQHDRQRFEVVGVSYARHDDSAIRKRVAAAFERFVDTGDRSDDAVATLLREMEIDVAVDLGGVTTGGRPRIFTRRPAPVQVSYLGYPGTSGNPEIDYLLADETVVPAEDRRFYSEAVVTLPDSYYPNDDKRPGASETPARAEVGLPEAGIVFCCFNNSYKITPEIFDVWTAILAAVPGSVLWLLESNNAVPANLRREAAARGVAPERLVFAPSLSVERHLARHRLADLFLDTLYYNAHTTASDALWAGLPVITCPGETFASRVAASLLRAVGLPELIAPTLEDYRALAVRLATDPAALAAIKAKLAANRLTTPLFDTARLTRHLEAAYTTMVERQHSSLAPAAFAVPAG